MCKFCQKIWSSAKAFEESALCLDECAIVMKDGRHWLYDVNIFGDLVMWTNDVLQINFCPICGRKLKEEEDA